MPQLYQVAKQKKQKLMCKYGHKNVFYSRFEPAKQDRILRISIGFGFKPNFFISKFSLDRVRMADPRNTQKGYIYIYIYIYIQTYLGVRMTDPT